VGLEVQRDFSLQRSFMPPMCGALGYLADERLSECSMIKPFTNLGGEAIQLLTTALGRLLLGVDCPASGH
jgi:hypothetical protein